VQEFHDVSKVHPGGRGVIERTRRWLLTQQDADGTWSKIGGTHGIAMESMGDPKLLLTSYATYSMLESGLKAPELKKSAEYIRAHAKDAENAYALALAANALAAWGGKDDGTSEALAKVLQKLERLKQEKPEWRAACYPAQGQSLAYARGDSLTVETTALAVLAMLRSGLFTDSINRGLTYLIKSKGPSGAWGSTRATILALKALVAGAGGPKQRGKAAFTVTVNGQAAAKGQVAEGNADVLQQFDLAGHVRPGSDEVSIEARGDTMLYQAVSRHFELHRAEAQERPVLEVAMGYDRTSLSAADVLRAKAAAKYGGKGPTYTVIAVLGPSSSAPTPPPATRRLAVYLLDVSGHGVGSSLLAVSAANLLSAGPLPDTAFHGPGAVVARPNDVFQMEWESGNCFTPLYGTYDRAARTPAYCNAAHPTWPAPTASGWAAQGGPRSGWSSRPAPSPRSWRSAARRPTASRRWSPPPRWPRPDRPAVDQRRRRGGGGRRTRPGLPGGGAGDPPAGRPDGGGDAGHREHGAADAGRGIGRRPADGQVRRGGALRRRPGGGGQRPDRPDHRRGGGPQRALRVGQRGDEQPVGRRPADQRGDGQQRRQRA
jgi:hypothetical protein